MYKKSRYKHCHLNHAEPYMFHGHRMQNKFHRFPIANMLMDNDHLLQLNGTPTLATMEALEALVILQKEMRVAKTPNAKRKISNGLSLIREKLQIKDVNTHG